MSKVTQLERCGTGTGHPVSQSQSPHSFLPHLIIKKKTFKHTAKLKDFHREHMTIPHLDSDVNIITFTILFYRKSIQRLSPLLLFEEQPGKHFEGLGQMLPFLN